ncbi:unnamed protein product [Paramecium octaurelia]|uniref:Uncharacterized protein n=1 Tax=Paramecium octaurelia TaxID=43137 RepID=A0A8S1W771_PAROT|nr:unnamed protein product [Paramecium octaurelia]
MDLFSKYAVSWSIFLIIIIDIIRTQMKLCQILLFLNCQLLVLTIQNCKYSITLDLMAKSILRGHYKDVASESNGAMVSSARQNQFLGITNQNPSPLRDSIYAVQVNNGHINTFYLLEVSFAQTHEINQIMIWFYDLDNRNSYFNLTVKNKDNIEKVVFEGQHVQRIVKVSIPDQMVSSLKLTYMSGGTFADLVIFKIQAYYANRSST